MTFKKRTLFLIVIETLLHLKKIYSKDQNEASQMIFSRLYTTEKHRI